MPVALEPVPFEFATQTIPLIVVEGEVGDQGRPLRIVVDSGGGGPVGIYFGESVGEIPGMVVAQPEVLPAPFGDQPIHLRTGTIERITIGGITVDRTAVGQSNLVDRLSAQLGVPIDALIGHRFLADRVISIDYAARRIDFAARRGPEGAGVAVRITPAGGHLLADVLVNDSGPFVFLIDTGASSSHVSPEVARRLRIRARGNSLSHGAGGSARLPTGSARLSLAGREVAVANLLISAELARISERSGTRVDGILGVDWLATRPFTIDYPGRRLWLEVAPMAVPASPEGQ